MKQAKSIISKALDGKRISAAEALSLADFDDLQYLIDIAGAIRDQAHPDIITYSPKVFIPLTQLWFTTRENLLVRQISIQPQTRLFSTT